MAHFRQVLKNKNFFCLWIGQIISQFGDRLNQMALIGFVHQKSPGSTIALATLMLFVIVPVFVIGPVAGAYADRWNRKHMMMASDILRGFLVFLIPLCIYLRQALPIYLVVFIIFSLTRFFLSGKMAIIPSIVSKEELLVANSLSDTTRMIATVIGLGFAGFLVGWIGVAGSFYIDSATFFISALLLSTIAVKDVASPLKDDLLLAEKVIKGSIRKSIFSDIKMGFKYFIELRNVRFVALTYLVLMSGLGAISCVIIIFIQNSFATVTSGLGVLGMFLVAGLFIGAVSYGRFGHMFDKGKVVFTSLAVSGIGMVVFTFLVRTLQSLTVASTLSFIIGLFISPIVVSSNTLVHEVLPDGARGRVFSSLEALMHLGFLIFMLLASFLAEFMDRMWILIFVGSVFAICGASGLFLKFRGKD